MSSSTIQFRVVVNAEEQYSVWFLERPIPAGWTDTGTTGTRDECLAHIAEVWTDLTPRSVRERHRSVSA
ncbi:MbtH family NRPS accessory protein [Streptomyces sp. NPDC000070]|uniref:MbtH family protein n=1 Tax=Streptomyces sp. NPDC000070 TaxID=3154240 RepID=UPI00332D5BB6